MVACVWGCARRSLLPFRCPRTCRRPPTSIPGWLRDSFWQTRHREQEAGGGLKAPARWGVPSLATGKPWSPPWEHAAASRPQRPRGARGRPGPLPDVRVRPAADGVRSREEPSSWCRPNCQPAEPRPRPSLLCGAAEKHSPTTPRRAGSWRRGAWRWGRDRSGSAVAAFGAGEGRTRGHGAVLSARGCLTWDISIKKTEEGTEEGGREGGRGRLLCHDNDAADEAGGRTASSAAACHSPSSRVRDRTGF